jgi:hypothetical protein
MTDELHRELVAVVGRLWEQQLARDPQAAMAQFEALVAEHGTEAVGAALMIARRSRLSESGRENGHRP